VAENGNARKGYKTDPGRDAERDVTQPEGNYAADRGEGYTGEDPGRIQDPPVGEVQQGEDECQCHRDDDHQALLGTLEILELAAVTDIVAAWEFDLTFYGVPNIGYEASHVTATHVCLYDDPPLAPFTV